MDEKGVTGFFDFLPQTSRLRQRGGEMFAKILRNVSEIFRKMFAKFFD